MTKKVGIFYRLDRPGGIQSCAMAVIKGLNQRGVIPDVLWDVEPDRNLLSRNNLQANFKPIQFPIPTLFIDKLPDTLRYLAWIVNGVDSQRLNLNYDFYYIFHFCLLVPEGTPHLRYMPGPPILPKLETLPKGPAGIPLQFFEWVYKRFFRKVKPVYEFHPNDQYITISQFTASLFQETYGAELPVIYPPVNLARHSFRFDDLKDRDTLTFFSRFVDYKRPEMVLELASHYPDMRCVLMGGVPAHRHAYYESLKDLAATKNMANIHFQANPSQAEVDEELTRTRFYMFPVINEHFGMTTVEAIASGAVPFVHDFGGQREIVFDDRLRFSDSDILTRFGYLNRLNENGLNEIRQSLSAHIRQYSEESFITKMLAYLPV